MQVLTRKWAGTGALVVLGLATLAQAFQPEPPPLAPVKQQAAWETGAVDPRVRALLRRSCANCHSNDTQWPWYARISPGSWLLAHHVTQARRQLNFSIEYVLDEEEIGAIADAVENQVMPPRSYLLMHPEARLTDADRALVKRWWIGELPGAASE